MFWQKKNKKKNFGCNKHSRRCRDLDKKPWVLSQSLLKMVQWFHTRDEMLKCSLKLGSLLDLAVLVSEHNLRSKCSSKVVRFCSLTALHTVLLSQCQCFCYLSFWLRWKRKGEKSHQGHQQRSHLYPSPIIERVWRNEPVWSDEVRASGTLLLGAGTHLEQIESLSVS